MRVFFILLFLATTALPLPELAPKGQLEPVESIARRPRTWDGLPVLILLAQETKPAIPSA